MMPPRILVQLIHIQGGLKGEIQEFYDSPITVGRLSSCSVRFPADEPGVSREHAIIQRDGNQFKLVDLSKFGTYVNGKQVREALLKNGDVLEFGTTRLRFEVERQPDNEELKALIAREPGGAPSMMLKQR